MTKKPVFKTGSTCNADGCVGVAVMDVEVHIRDEKLGDASPVLTAGSDEWEAFRRGIIAGEF